MVESSCTHHPQVTLLAVTPRKPPDCFSGSSNEQLSFCPCLLHGEKLHTLFSPLCTLHVPRGGFQKPPWIFWTNASEMVVIGKKIARVGLEHLAPHGSRWEAEGLMRTLCCPSLSPALGRAGTSCHLPAGGRGWKEKVKSCNSLSLNPKRKWGSSRDFVLTRCKTSDHFIWDSLR